MVASSEFSRGLALGILRRKMMHGVVLRPSPQLPQPEAPAGLLARALSAPAPHGHASPELSASANSAVVLGHHRSVASRRSRRPPPSKRPTACRRSTFPSGSLDEGYSAATSRAGRSASSPAVP